MLENQMQQNQLVENGCMPKVKFSCKLKQSYAHVHKLGDNVTHTIGKGITLKQVKEKDIGDDKEGEGNQKISDRDADSKRVDRVDGRFKNKTDTTKIFNNDKSQNDIIKKFDKK